MFFFCTYVCVIPRRNSRTCTNPFSSRAVLCSAHAAPALIPLALEVLLHPIEHVVIHNALVFAVVKLSLKLYAPGVDHIGQAGCGASF